VAFFNTQSKKRGFCVASLFKHVACLKNPQGADFRVSPVGAWRRDASSKNGGTSLYRDGQEALVPRSAGMRESGHRRVMKNSFFITLLIFFTA